MAIYLVQVGACGESTSASGNGTFKVCARLLSPLTSLRRSGGRDVRFTDWDVESVRVDPVGRLAARRSHL